MVSGGFGLAYRGAYDAGTDQMVDGAVIEAGIEENCAAIRADIRRGPQIILGKPHEARRARRVYQSNAGRILANRRFRCLDVNIMQPVAGIEDTLCDDVRGMKPGKPGFARQSEEALAHLRDQCIRRVCTLGEIQEPRIAGKKAVSMPRFICRPWSKTPATSVLKLRGSSSPSCRTICPRVRSALQCCMPALHRRTYR